MKDINTCPQAIRYMVWKVNIPRATRKALYTMYH